MQKSVIIIGAGVAGLSAGCYARMNGFETKIFELHKIPGGLCTAWQRKDYLFDGCIHYLYGSGEGKPFNQVWQELGAVKGRQFVNHTELMRVQGTDGRTFICYADPDRLEQHACELSPADANLIRSFCKAIKLFQRFDMTALSNKPRSLWTPQDWAAFGQQMLPFLPALAKWSLLSAGEFGKKFKDPLLQKAIPLIFGWPEIPMMAGLSILGYMSIQNAGFPVGASLDFAQAIEQRYRDLGGEIYYDAQVERILVRNDRAVGVRLYNNEEYFADHVISAGDGRSTIFDMLEGKYTNAEIRSIYDHESGFEAHSMIQISMGVRRDFSNEPHWVTYLLDKPILLAGEERDSIGLKHYCFDPSLAPQGRSALEVILRINYAYWHRIYGHKLYACEQDEVVDILTTQLEAFHPGLKADIEITDCATPLSYERYTGNWRGSSVGWLLTKKTMLKMISGMRKTLPGLKNFYLAGQWVEPGGSVPVVAMSGRNAVQLICHAEGIPFTTTIA